MGSHKALTMTQRVIVCTLAIGGHYPRLAARQIERFAACSPGYEIMAWINTLPYGAPAAVIEDGYDYTPYCAKPFALEAARVAGADIAILLDAAMYPIRPIAPLIAHIHRHNYFACANGASLGEWLSDRALGTLSISRENAMQLAEVSSYCVGLHLRDPRALRLLEAWMRLSMDRVTVPGHHTATGIEGRNQGFVSSDPRVRGHRH